MMHGHMHGHGRGHGHGDNWNPHGHGKVLGTTTVGERGQVVIPAEAREALNIEPGDKFVVFGDRRGNTVSLVKADVISRFADIFMGKSEKYEAMAQEILDQIGEDMPADDEADDATGDAPADETAGDATAGESAAE